MVPIRGAIGDTHYIYNTHYIYWIALSTCDVFMELLEYLRSEPRPFSYMGYNRNVDF